MARRVAKVLARSALAVLTVVAAGWVFLAVGTPHPPAGDITRPAVEDWAERLTRTGAATAVSVTVLRRGNVVWEFSAGVANPFLQQPANADSLYHVWSLTKVATALAVLDLAEEGALDLDRPVLEFLPWLEFHDERARHMSVRDLLRHTSGLRDTVPAVFGWLNYDGQLPDQTGFLKEKMPGYRSLRFSPGEDRKYSNLGYMVLGAIIEAITGRDYAAVISERVLRPSGMSSASFVFPPGPSAEEALGSHPVWHIFTPLLPFLADIDALVDERVGRLLWLNRVYVEATPPTGLIAKARDVARLGHAAMTKGVVLDGEMLDLLASPAPGEASLGWFESGHEHGRWLQHRGGGPGFAAALLIYPEHELSIAVLASGTAAPVIPIADLVAQAVFPDTNLRAHGIAPLGIVHLTLAIAALGIGASILLSRKGTPTHKIHGRAFAAAMLTSNIVALAIYRDADRLGVFHFLAIISIASIILAIVLIRLPNQNRARILIHGQLMTWSYAGVVAAGLGQTATMFNLAPWPIILATFLATAFVTSRRTPTA